MKKRSSQRRRDIHFRNSLLGLQPQDFRAIRQVNFDSKQSASVSASRQYVLDRSAQLLCAAHDSVPTIPIRENKPRVLLLRHPKFQRKLPLARCESW